MPMSFAELELLGRLSGDRLLSSVLLAVSEEIPVQWLQLPRNNHQPANEVIRQAGMFIPLDGSLSLQGMEKHILQEVVLRANNNVTAAARMRRATRETLRYRVQKHHLKYEGD